MGDEVLITCLCGRVNETVQLTERIPVRTTPCHCNSCRYTLGALFHSALPVSKPPTCIDSLSKHETSNPIRRYFCSSCGTHVTWHDSRTDLWVILSGAVDRLPDHASGMLQTVVAHQYIEDTKDGGLSICLTNTQSETPKSFLREAHNSPEISTELMTGPRESASGSKLDRLHGSCHCEGVQFYLTRPDESSKQWSSPWPDLIVPYCSRSPENPDDVKWWIRDNGKWFAGTCGCRSCRLGLGSPIMTWAFVAKSNLFKSDGSPLDYDFGTLKAFESSPEHYREFCTGCGATIFWHNTERPGVVDVSVGVLRAEEGARAQTWLDWCTGRTSFAEEALDKHLIDTLEVGLHHLNR